MWQKSKSPNIAHVYLDYKYPAYIQMFQWYFILISKETS